MSLAPILLFVYNRPEHTKKTIEALRNNYLAKESDVFVFSDGSKNEKTLEKIKEVRNYLKTLEEEKYFKKVNIFESNVNKGLANSIIIGVNKIINKHGKVIVLEDDLITHPNFLTFMNESLNFYQFDKKIWSISGYCPPIKIPDNYYDEIFLGPRASSWGWATWKDRWILNDWNINDFNNFIKNKKLQKTFNIGGADMTEMLRSQIEGEIDSWAIRWCYNQFKHNMYTIFPVKSYIDNIGTDGSGTHFKTINNKYKVNLKESLEKINLKKDISLNTDILNNFKKAFPSNKVVFIKKLLKKIKLYKIIRKIYHKLRS